MTHLESLTAKAYVAEFKFSNLWDYEQALFDDSEQWRPRVANGRMLWKFGGTEIRSISPLTGCYVDSYRVYRNADGTWEGFYQTRHSHYWAPVRAVAGCPPRS